MSYIPTHRSPTRNRRGLRVAGAASLALGTLLAFSSPAAAFDNYTEANANDGSSIGRCALTLTNANYSNGTVRANINASARPAALNGVFDNTHVAVLCQLFPKGGGPLLATVFSEADGAFTSKSAISTQPLYADYEICASVATTLRSGQTKGAGPVCVG